jgi:hypothetical protein
MEEESKWWGNVMENCYRFQTSLYWRKFLLVLSYMFMYVVLFSHNKPGIFQSWFELSVIFLLWIDVILQLTYRSFLTSRKIISSLRFYAKLVIIISLTGDEVISMVSEEDVFRPFLFLRASRYISYYRFANILQCSVKEILLIDYLSL